jgi:predicted ArsR family transcriptional regulator
MTGARIQKRIRRVSEDWSRIGQIAARVGITPQRARRVVAELVALGDMEQMGSSPVTMQPRPMYRTTQIHRGKAA